MDGTTIAISIVCSLLGSGVLATLVAKWFDARASSREEERADRAADNALERKLRGDRATLQLERRRQQEAAVDAMLGHVVSLVSKGGRREMMSSAEVASALQSPPNFDDADLGRLMGTDHGRAIVSAYTRCKEQFRRSVPRSDRLNSPPAPSASLEPLTTSAVELDQAAQRWRAI
jgi:hypothetical protein